MQVRAGDHLVIESNRLGTPPRRATVLEALGGEAVRVRWEDGRETVFVPGSDCRVDRRPDDGRQTTLGCHIDLRVVEDETSCEATATLITERGTFEAKGTSRRHPDDPVVPMIGEELAIARALHMLSRQLTDGAYTAIRTHEDRPVHLIG